MRKFRMTFVLFFVVVFQVTVLAQTSDIEPKLLDSFFKGDHPEFIYGVASRITDLAAETDDDFVIRICSSNNLSDSIATSAGKPYELIEMLQRFKVDIKRVFFATNSGCASKSQNPKLVEYWLVPKKAELKLDEKIRADKVKVKYYFSTEMNFEENLRTFSQDLKDKTSKGYIIGYYFRASSKELKENLRKTCNFLKNDVSNSQLKCYTSKWYGILDGNEVEPKYPLLLIVDLIQ